MIKMKTTEQKVIKFIDSKSLINKDEKLLLGLSGGPDSVFALKFFVKYKKKYKFNLVALHINHNLRGQDSEKDEDFCKTLCLNEGIDLIVKKIEVKDFAKKKKLSIEEAARQIRYNLFSEAAKEYNCTKVVTAHNKSDNTETVLINLIKGTGIKGLSGIPVQRDNIIRPFLCVTKDEITSYLKANGIDSRLDKSNDSNEFQRNYLRNVVLKGIKEEINPSIDDAFFRTSQNLYKTNEILLRQIRGIIRNEIKISGNEVLIPMSIKDEYGEEFLGEIIREVLAGNFAIEADHTTVEKINGLFSKQVGKFVELKKQVLCFRERDSIRITNRKMEIKISKKLKLGSTVKLAGKNLQIKEVEAGQIEKSGGTIEYLDLHKLSDEFEVRNWEKGDKFVPLGLKNFKKVSDFLTDIKVRSSERQSQLVLLNGGKIIWVIGRRIDDRFKITEQTQKAVKLWLK